MSRPGYFVSELLCNTFARQFSLSVQNVWQLYSNCWDTVLRQFWDRILEVSCFRFWVGNKVYSIGMCEHKLNDYLSDKNIFFWVITPRQLEEGKYCLHFQGWRVSQAGNRLVWLLPASCWFLFSPENGDSAFLQNVSEFLPDYMVLHSRR
jgi:hypothetical protein